MRVRHIGLSFALASVVLGFAGCEVAPGAPVAPSAAAPVALATAFVIPDQLASSLALIEADPRPLPLLGEAPGPWLRRVVRGVVFDDTLPRSVRAECCGADRLIKWSTAWMPSAHDPHQVRLAAAILIHEARHADGYRHTCPDQRRDRTLDEGGAWAVHAEWLRMAGDAATAARITASDIGCR